MITLILLYFLGWKTRVFIRHTIVILISNNVIIVIITDVTQPMSPGQDASLDIIICPQIDIRAYFHCSFFLMTVAVLVL